MRDCFKSKADKGELINGFYFVPFIVHNLLQKYLEAERDKSFTEAGYATPNQYGCNHAKLNERHNIRTQRTRLLEIVFLLVSLAALLYVNYFAYQESFEKLFLG